MWNVYAIPWFILTYFECAAMKQSIWWLTFHVFRPYCSFEILFRCFDVHRNFNSLVIYGICVYVFNEVVVFCLATGHRRMPSWNEHMREKSTASFWWVKVLYTKLINFYLWTINNFLLTDSSFNLLTETIHDVHWGPHEQTPETIAFVSPYYFYSEVIH